MITSRLTIHKDVRTFQDDGEEDKSRTSKATSNVVVEGVLGTSIDFNSGKDAGKLNHTHRKSQKKEVPLLRAFGELANWVEKLKAPSKAVTTVQQIYKVLSENTRITSANEKQAMAACLFKGLKIEGKAVTIKGLCALMSVARLDVNNMVSTIGKIPQLKELTISDRNSPKSFIESFSHELGLPTKVLSLALDVADKLTNVGADAGKNPSTNAAACIVFASENHPDKKIARITEHNVEAVSGITNLTIRKAVNDFNKFKNKLLE